MGSPQSTPRLEPAARTTTRLGSGAVASRPPKAPPPRKARSAAECERLEQLPNIGPAIAADLRLLGVSHPQQLAGRDAHGLYLALCRITGKRQDPCVLDTFMAATDFMGGAEPRPWWAYTAERKLRHGVT
jgi:Pathogenicity locus